MFLHDIKMPKCASPRCLNSEETEQMDSNILVSNLFLDRQCYISIHLADFMNCTFILFFKIRLSDWAKKLVRHYVIALNRIVVDNQLCMKSRQLVQKSFI